MSITNKIIYSINVEKEYIDNHNITEKIYETTFQSYAILNTQTTINELDTTISNDNYHSIILEYPSKRLLSFAPPIHTTDFSSFIQENDDTFYINEFVEGTFIHLFYDLRISAWEIATKRAIGGNYSYFHIPGKEKTTYREMIMEAFREKNMDLHQLPFLDFLPKKYCYSFVLQHPANHIVIPIEIPRMYLVSVYEINSETNTATFISPIEYQSWPEFVNLKDGLIYFPKQFVIDNSNSNNINECMKLIQLYASIHTPYTQMGLMFTNINTGKRCSIINPNYEEICKVRGNYTNIQYQYLCLRRINKVMNFLTFFPQYRSLFYEYKEQMDRFIYNIHQCYISYYIQKSGNFISKKYFSIIYAIHHSVFLPSVQHSIQSGIYEKTIIKKPIIKEFLNQMDPGKLLHILNSELLVTNKDENIFE
jgi:hypothetical protein